MSPRRIYQQQRAGDRNNGEHIRNMIPGYTEFYTHMPIAHPMLFGEFPHPEFKTGGIFAARVGFYVCAIFISVAALDELHVLLGSKILSMRNAV